MNASLGSTRIARAILISGLLVAAATPSHAAAAECTARFTATFNPPLSGTTAGTGSLRIDGTLAECIQALDNGYLLESGNLAATASAGTVWTDPATGFKWQEPLGRIDGTCINNNAAATMITRWNDGAITITNYESTSLTYGIATSGTNVAGVALTAVDKQAGQADTLTLNATRHVGGTMAGILFAADWADPVGSGQGAFNACSGTGLQSVLLNGSQTFAS